MTDREYWDAYLKTLNARLEELDHPGFVHSGSISDGSMVSCLVCGEMVECHESTDQLKHLETCRPPQKAESKPSPIK